MECIFKLAFTNMWWMRPMIICTMVALVAIFLGVFGIIPRAYAINIGAILGMPFILFVALLLTYEALSLQSSYPI